LEDDERLERWIDWPDLLGSRTGPVSGGFMANAWVRLTHPDYDELRRMMDTVGRTVRVHAGPA
jgi:hypothetical protein